MRVPLPAWMYSARAEEADFPAPDDAGGAEEAGDDVLVVSPSVERTEIATGIDWRERLAVWRGNVAHWFQASVAAVHAGAEAVREKAIAAWEQVTTPAELRDDEALADDDDDEAETDEVAATYLPPQSELLPPDETVDWEEEAGDEEAGDSVADADDVDADIEHDTLVVAAPQASPLLAVSPLRSVLGFVDRHLAALLLVCVAVLVAIGTILIYSASATVAMQTEAIGDSTFFLKRHLMALAVGLLLCAVAATITLERWRRIAVPLYVFALVALVAVLIPGIGTELNGARRWIRLGGGIGFQPSDLAKIAIVVILAAHLSRRIVQRRLASFTRGFLPTMAWLAPVALLIVVEPDMGTTLFLVTAAVSVFVIAGGRFRHVAIAAGPVLVLLATVIFLKFDHVRPRIETYLAPESDPGGAGYQVMQSLIALGAGGVSGVGLGQSRQSLFYLPEESTDFIFAVLGEELGLLGVLLVLAMYCGIALLCLRIAWHTPSRFGQLIAAGIGLLIAGQAAMNVAVVTASVPNTGIALPFISYGGSLTVAYLGGLGLVLAVVRTLPATVGHVAVTDDEAATLLASQEASAREAEEEALPDDEDERACVPDADEQEVSPGEPPELGPLVSDSWSPEDAEPWFPAAAETRTAVDVERYYTAAGQGIAAPEASDAADATLLHVPPARTLGPVRFLQCDAQPIDTGDAFAAHVGEVGDTDIRGFLPRDDEEAAEPNPTEATKPTRRRTRVRVVPDTQAIDSHGSVVVGPLVPIGQRVRIRPAVPSSPEDELGGGEPTERRRSITTIRRPDRSAG